MISHLCGKVLEIYGNQITLDVAGVGYEVFASKALVSSANLGEEIKAVIATEVRQDQIRLYGFIDRLEKQVYLLLQNVKGIGPKSASEIISNVDKIELLRLIATSNNTALQSLKGVGKKTAERLITELHDKVGEYAIGEQSYNPSRLDKAAASQAIDLEAILALQALGFQRRLAEQAVAKAKVDSPSSSTSDLVKKALRYV
jgi:Holliday junction DNA helicase RuvA